MVKIGIERRCRHPVARGMAEQQAGNRGLAGAAL